MEKLEEPVVLTGAGRRFNGPDQGLDLVPLRPPGRQRSS